jgi:hypothetical protein
LLRQHLDDVGLRYLASQPSTLRHVLVPEDLAVTILISSRVGWRVFAGVQDYRPTVNLGVLPDKPVEHTTEPE